MGIKKAHLSDLFQLNPIDTTFQGMSGTSLTDAIRENSF